MTTREALIVETDPAIANAVERGLRGIGLEPRAIHRRDLTPAIEQRSPALLVFAAEALGIDELRAVRERWTLPTVQMVATGDACLVDPLHPHDTCPLLVKPFSDEQLRCTVQVVLRRSTPKLEQALQQIAHVLMRAGMFPGDESKAMRALPAIDTLSPREVEVLRALMRSQRVPTIAKSLTISSHTVRNHLKAIYTKLGVHSQAELLELVSG